MLDAAREGMDLSVRATDDLFGHVNGTWLATTPIPDDRSSWGPFVALAEEAQVQVRAIVEEHAAADPATLGEDERRIAALYRSFLDTDTIAERGITPIEPYLHAVAGLRDLRELAALVGELERVGGTGFFGSYVSTDAKDSDRYLFQVYQGGLGLPDESYYREERFAEVVEKYRAYLVRLLGLVGQDDPEAAADTVLALDRRLAEGHWERAETRDVQKTYNLLTLEELVELCPAFDWEVYARNLAGATLDASDVLGEVVVRQPSYFAHLSQVLGDVPVESWRTWLVSRVLRAFAPYLTDELVETNFDFYGRTLSGTPELRARWKRAISFVENAVGEAVGRAYVERHFPPVAKEKMDALVENLVEAYRRSIRGLDWMTEETKERALEKLGQFVPKIGYPDRWRDYSGLVAVPDDLVDNVAAASAFETDRQLGKLGGPVDRDEWLMLPQTVNAYYNPGTNEICFPAAILHPPFFSPDADPAENYGGIGAVIGHEIGHGFDDQGSQYDGRGNLENWWSEADRAAFEVKRDALVEQYDGFSPRNLPGETVNGSLTVGENIGDLGGLTIAHKAYLISLGLDPDGGPTTTADEDGLTGSQRLFLSWGHVWRTKRRLEQERQFLAIDPHSPSEFRANIVRNLDEFHAAFGTAPGDGLWVDPERRVRIW
ncbi:M13-type metalloendopeptidase [Nocardioides zeae]|uniref:M13-type metalloendopeptidase n=1 Tax=Nocardioides imazamoxiresistens TaxID=3231893 RepID=A0ABU3PVA1_9ACTN|nr:M13-type metalloendopeptidase [Nocardioides zeae]MDT9593169.1 M13-type metalloendopeptidase [Nocardioides zeae]